MNAEFKLHNTSIRRQFLFVVMRSQDFEHTPYVTLQMPDDIAKYLVDTATSYSKHFGDNAEKAAEEDVLGKLISAARMAVDNFTRTDDKFLNDDDLAAWNALAEAISFTKASKP